VPDWATVRQSARRHRRCPAVLEEGDTCRTCGCFPMKGMGKPTATRSSPAPTRPTANTCFRAAGMVVCACGKLPRAGHWARSRSPPSPSPPAAVSCDGTQLVSGTLDGMLARWDAGSRRQSSLFLAHTRPISAIAFANDGRTMATASWDRTLILAVTGRDSRTLSGHNDIVAGCCFNPNANPSYPGRMTIRSGSGNSAPGERSPRSRISPIG